MFSQPIAMAVRKDDPAFYVAERKGLIRVVKSGRVAAQPLLDLSSEVSTAAEQGLLSLVFSPDGSYLYVSYTDSRGDSRLVEYAFANGKVDLESVRTVVALDQPFADHNGGNLVFGPDGLLYIGFGDGGSSGDPMHNGQSLDTLLGKIIRIDPDQRTGRSTGYPVLKKMYRWRDGDEVLVPAVTFVATVNVVLHNRMTPVFVDVDRRTYNIDPARLADAIGPRTRCVIPVHLMGLPADMDEVRATRLKIIEDSCEAMFARYRGSSVGAMGDVGCFSTYVAHYIVTGVGGLATTNDPELEVALRSLINHGRDPRYLNIDDDDLSGRQLQDVVESRFRFLTPGHSFRCTELEAAIGLAQLRRYREIVKARRANGQYLSDGLADLTDHIQLPHTPADREHALMLYPIVVLGEDSSGLVSFLEASGIETRDLMPIVGQPVYRGMIRKRLPTARWLRDRGFYIGCHQYLKRRHLDYVIERIHAYFRSAKRKQ